jgi:glycosyltransferase involved in cell wall biosynthesis
MHVLQVNKFFYEKGGTERYFFSVSHALEKRGHAVTHFSMVHPGNRESPFAPFFVSQKSYSGHGATLGDVRAGLSFIRSGEAAACLRRLIERSKPDVAHLHNIYHQITPSIIPVLKQAGVPVVMTLHDYKLICPNYSLFDGKMYCYRCKGRRFYRAARTRCHERSFAKSLLLSIEAYWQKRTRVYDGVRVFLAPSRYIRDAFIGEGFSAQRVVYLPPFVPDDDSAAGVLSEHDAALVDALPKRYIAYFGRLSAEKGLLTLVDAVGRVMRAPLVICGDGPLRKALEERAKETRARVHFTGHLERRVLRAVVERATAVVLPSESPENAPYTVLEAMAMGVPVIVSSMGGLPELAGRGGGVVFTAGDAAELAAKIYEFWETPTLASEIGQCGRRVAAEQLTEERHIESLVSIYQKAIEGN